MGLLTKFGFRASGRLGIAPFHGIRVRVTAENPRPMSWVMWPFGAGHCFGFVGGARAWELSAAGAAATEAAARAEFAGMFGHGHLGAGLVTDWGENRHFLGSYSQARPGAAEARSVLAEPLGPLRFAGEATHRGLAGTIGGAWAEGARAAQAA
jgi:monoamine oxidase